MSAPTLNMRMVFKNVVFAAVFLAISGCVKNNPDPSWLSVGKWTLNANPNLSGAEGELSHNLSEAWVYVDDQCVGVFELPVKIPLLKSGSVNVKVYPGVKINGISSTKRIYPFCKVFEQTVNLVKKQTVTLSPATSYNSYANFIIEDFEGANVLLDNDPNTSIANYFINNQSLQWFNGNAYAQVNLNAADSIWIAYTTFNSFHAKGKEVYLEIDYYTTNRIITGLIAISPGGIKKNTNIQLNKSTPENVKWKKIYIDLKELIVASDANAYFDHSFEAFKEPGMANTLIRIDNVKVVYFQ
ncbi:MAG: hypothetical protein FJZ80_04175 [Bacteroidetes bacterium]|nr:hypothetical protein [Bacteroidota bacterium]MBM3424320.1 hypothetical protein [Bacteroidota bacterium]